MEKLINKYKAIHPKYFNENINNTFVFNSCDNYIIIFNKLNDTKTNELRPGIKCEKYAEYTANKLQVELIFDMYFPLDTLDKLQSVKPFQYIEYKKGEIIHESENFRLFYYKNIYPAFFECIEILYYTGYYYSWYDNGIKSEEGFYNRGTKEGEWNYWYPNGYLSSRGMYLHGDKYDIWEEFDNFGDYEDDIVLVKNYSTNHKYQLILKKETTFQIYLKYLQNVYNGLHKNVEMCILIVNNWIRFNSRIN